MSFFGKRAGQLLGNVMKEIVEDPSGQPQQNMAPPQPEPQPQGNQGGPSDDFFNQSFMAPPLGELPQQTTGDQTLSVLKLPDEHNNTIPDFSRVGYRQGHVQIPTATVRVVIEPSNDANQDDTARIQAAIDQVAQMSPEPVGQDGAALRGAVLLRAGTYRVQGALILNASGIVLRGEGQDEQGTILLATGSVQRDFILVNGMLTSDMGRPEMQQNKGHSKEMMPTNSYGGNKDKGTTTQPGIYIPVGETHLPVMDVSSFHVGEQIVVERPGSAEWIHDIGMDQLPPRPDQHPTAQWEEGSYIFRFERTIVDIDPATNSLVLDIPMVMSLDPKYPPARIYTLIYKFPVISDVGIENLCLMSETDPVDGEDEQHAWYAVVLDNVVHGWVADVATFHFVSGIYASTWSRFITIQDCSVVDPVSKATEGGRRYQFNLSGQMGLVKRCFTNNARHDFITLAKVCGPNVFVDSTGVNANNDTGPHERWAMGTLYDNITCETINVRQRLWKGSGQGWAGAYQVVYNCTATSHNSCFQDAPGSTNWIIGFKGGQTNEPEFSAQSTRVMAVESTVEPRSLYWAQLVDRMGGDAAGVENAVGEAAKKQYPR